MAAADRYLYFSCMRPARQYRGAQVWAPLVSTYASASALPYGLACGPMFPQCLSYRPFKPRPQALESHPPLQRLPPSSYHDRQLAASSHVFPHPAVARSGQTSFSDAYRKTRMGDVSIGHRYIRQGPAAGLVSLSQKPLNRSVLWGDETTALFSSAGTGLSSTVTAR